ncbi:MAG: dTDP-4-dehydrorhamnose reductase [Saprospiraceae bacterium]|nr:dTDP-4-dehydrorhamnose reductase [Saprospiraceae bacterium]
MPFNILVTGAHGQVGSQLVLRLKQEADIKVHAYGHKQLDLTDANAILHVITDEIHAVVNCAAYTQVDLAQSDPSAAWNINAVAPELMAKACHQKNILFLHYSTDYVYDNDQTRPLTETDPCCPKSIYAITKYEGEQKALYYNPKTIILRTSWVYSRQGQNFVNTIIRLAQEKSELLVVDDQLGAPTYTPNLVDATLTILRRYLEYGSSNIFGIYNFANDGAISWYEFAKKIVAMRLIDCKVLPTSTQSFPRPAPRPRYSIFELTKIQAVFGIKPVPWEIALQECIQPEKAYPTLD